MRYYLFMLRFFVIRTISLLKIKLKGKGNSPSEPAVSLDPAAIPKFVNQLAKPPAYKPFVIKTKEKKGENKKGGCKKKKEHLYFVDMSQFKQQILPEGLPETTVWGYGGLIKDDKTGRTVYSRSAPGATIEAVRNIPVTVKWFNKLTGKNLFAVDPTLHWANPNKMPMEPPMPWPPFPPGFRKAQSPVPTVAHLHGGETPSVYDGHPDAWFTHGCKKGPDFLTSRYSYPNQQNAATLWYHDHALGITRLNVYAGLAGFYLLRDEKCGQTCQPGKGCGEELILPEGQYEMPIVIQDRSFNTDGTFTFNNVGINPNVHPYWVPEFFGNTIMVNGSVWPNLDVERRQYRLRVLNGSNARFYNLKMSNGMKFTQIGTDGGFLPKPVLLDTLLIAPGERADILVDFSDSKPGTSLVLLNTAKAPYPAGDPADENTVGQIMQFTVPINAAPPVKPPKLPSKLNCIPELTRNVPQRTLTLNEVMGDNGPLEVLLNGQKWEAPVSELPIVGSTEDWVIANLTADTHPIHLHLVQFQLINRQDFKADEYKALWDKMNGMPPLSHPTEVLSVNRFLVGDPIEPDENEKGWKDTVRMNPNQVTRIRVRFAPQDVPASGVKPGENFFPFDPTRGPGYVWHCHILDHEDNEMMRPFLVI